MPVVNGVGFSDYTPEKQQIFADILTQHISICQVIYRRYEKTKRYYYYDLTAGCGKDHCYGEGSPLIFAKIAARKELFYTASFYEREKVNFDKLKRNLDPYSDCWCFNNPYQKMNRGDFPEKSSLGLLYVDPSGNPPDFDFFMALSQQPEWKNIDFLFNFSATNIKRLMGAGLMAHLKEEIQKISKTTWIIREPARGKHQWTFFLGTNYEAFKPSKRNRFHRLDSRAGQFVFNRLNYTIKENAAIPHYGQQYLFDLWG